MRTTLTALLFVALAAAPVSAATLKLKNGQSVQCKVVAYDAPAKTLRVRLEDGREARYTLDQLDARSVYLVNSSLVPKDDAKALLQVANFARDAGLYAHAVRRYGEALKLDPSLKATIDQEMISLKRGAAAMCMENARAAVTQNDLKEAEKWLTILVKKLPDEPEGKQASAMLDNYYEQNRTKQVAAADEKATDAIKKDVANGKKHFEQMVEKSKRGLQAEGNSQSEALFRAAIVDGKAVMKEIDRIEKKYDDPDLREKVSAYRKIAIDQLVEVHMNLASRQCVQSDYRGGLNSVEAALALDPKNESALAMRARIEEYSSQPVGWRVWI
jgi:tetratricopeptide (TPR) repeat protein